MTIIVLDFFPEINKQESEHGWERQLFSPAWGGVFSYCFLPLSHSSAKLHIGVLFRIIRLPVAGPEQGLHWVTFHSALKWSRASRILCQGQRDSVTLGLWRTGKDIQHAQTMALYVCFSSGNGSVLTKEDMYGIDFKMVCVKAQSPIPTFLLILQ